MTIDFYYSLPSPACRSVLLVARALGLELNLKTVSVRDGQHKTPQFLKKNPQHCIPTIDDNGFVLWESRAILCYLVNQYGKDDALYPMDAKKRALIDQRLYFDIGTLFPRLSDYFWTLKTGNPPDETTITKLEEAFQILDTFLEGQDWLAGDNITIADYALVVNVSFTEIIKYDLSKYQNITKWYERSKTTMVGFLELQEAGNAEIRKMKAIYGSMHKHKGKE